MNPTLNVTYHVGVPNSSLCFTRYNPEEYHLQALPGSLLSVVDICYLDAAGCLQQGLEERQTK